MMLAYLGPESVAPVASAIAAFLGFLLICWRRVVRACKRVFRFVFRLPDPAERDASTAIGGAPSTGCTAEASVPQDQPS